MAHDLSAAEAHEPITRPPRSATRCRTTRAPTAIRFAKHDGPSAGCGHLRATRLWWAGSEKGWAGPGWLPFACFCQLGAPGEAMSLPGRA
jgi:hypothetical protein